MRPPAEKPRTPILCGSMPNVAACSRSRPIARCASCNAIGSTGEAARVLDGVYAALRPMMATSDGQLIALTTPYGRRGWFFDEWQREEGWEKQSITALDCPRISEEFLIEERESMGNWRFRQEYLCEFVDSDEQFFSSELIDAMTDETLEVWA